MRITSSEPAARQANLNAVVEVHTPSITNLDDQNEQEPREECGVYGVWAPGEEVSKLTYFGLFALQHRGQEAAGIAVGDDDRIVVFKDMGLVANIFDESTLSALQGNVAVGHTRYSTAGGKEWSNVQPMFSTSSTGVDIALGHNGNLINYLELREEAVQRGLIKPQEESVSDSMCLSMLLADGVDEDTSVFDSARDLLPRVKGAFCLTFTDGHTMYAARDPHGVRPLVLGRLAKGWVVASETCALDICGAQDVAGGAVVLVELLASKRHTNSGRNALAQGAGAHINARRIVKGNANDWADHLRDDIFVHA